MTRTHRKTNSERNTDANHAKRDYKSKVEQLLKDNTVREAWHRIKTILGTNSQWTNSAQTVEFAIGLNYFITHHETDRSSLSEPTGDWKEGGTPIYITSEQVWPPSPR